MSLLALHSSNSSTVSELTIEQIVAIAGDGKLTDNSECSKELQEYLLQASSDKLALYLEHCLTSSFSNSGYVLQDIVNELGRRLNYEVKNGRYKGVKNAIGFDGIWTSPDIDNHHIVVEVKTTDAYRISLDTISKYRQELLKTEVIKEPSSVLIIVGREDTGELESQVRGSRHAWDIRLIGADALIKLVKLKESIGDMDTEKKIRSVLVPMEYTKLDTLIDVMFTTAKDVESVVHEERPEDDVLPDKEKTSDSQEEKIEVSTRQAEKNQLLNRKRNIIINAISKIEQVSFIKNTQATYWDVSHRIRLVVPVSRIYDSGGYWFTYPKRWDLFLDEGEKSFLVLGCMDLEITYVIPHKIIQSNLKYLHTTPKKEKSDLFWHIRIEHGQKAISLSKIKNTLPLDEYVIKLD
jgi:hypothetical protein